MFSGGGSSEAAQPAQQQTAPQAASYDQHAQSFQGVRSCDADAKAFTRCLESTNNDMSSCQYYLDMLKQCQSFASSQSL
ncbi:hypothetical protein DL89DRAFT_266925 [Linderina pennispora]|uniref:CHCH domain-containing protein n=1 Tax=Linderina pennispora TaxID=61395 RepID=A0A1Y1WBP5_9FUNG|nr:uncharacterized protein DL89DRAFT_266925 [Linderina pennispora]ORX70795.1 hypothetical protein DL89DRAFT_266925 [Linderina pennispora]